MEVLFRRLQITNPKMGPASCSHASTMLEKQMDGVVFWSEPTEASLLLLMMLRWFCET